MAKKPCQRCGTMIGVFSSIEVSGRDYCLECSKVVKEEEKRSKQERQEIPNAELDNILCVTSRNVHGYNVVEYKGVVHAQVILGVNAWKDLTTSIRSWWGGRAESLEGELRSGFALADEELKKEAFLVGANAVIAAQFDGDLEVAGESGSNDKMLMVSASGTAVRIERV